MTTSRKGEFAVHCIRCGKNFYADTTPPNVHVLVCKTCGAQSIGWSWHSLEKMK